MIFPFSLTGHPESSHSIHSPDDELEDDELEDDELEDDELEDDELEDDELEDEIHPGVQDSVIVIPYFTKSDTIAR